MRYIIIAIIVSLCLQVYGQQQELEVYFGEVDFAEVEGEGAITASILKEGILTSDLFLDIIPLTYDEFDARGFDLDEERRKDRPDPAEFELDGRKDFDNTTLEVVLKASITRDDYTVSIPVTRDDINEAKEGFMIVMRANEEKSSPEDVKNLQYRDNGVTLGIIDDDDPITVGFERSSYTVNEADGVVSDLVFVIKQDGRITEQVLELATTSFDGTAKSDEDYIASQASIVFQPDVMRIPLTITLLDDDVPENTENFKLVFSRKVGTPNLRLGRRETTIIIEDGDVVEVGFNQSSYFVAETESVSVCVDLISPEAIQENALVVLTVSTGEGTASASDFSILTNLVAVGNQMKQSCFDVQALSDSLLEATENITLIITAESFRNNIENIFVSRPTTTIIIEDRTVVVGFNQLSYLVTETESVSVCVDLIRSDIENALVNLTVSTGEGNASASDFLILTNLVTVGNQMKQSCFEVQGLNDSLMEGTEFVPIIITAESDRNDIENIIVSRPNTTLQILDLVVDIVMIDPNITRCEDGHDCSYYAVCVDSDDGYVCRCHKGYYGDGRTCIDRNECKEGSARCYHHSRCVNVKGGYRCICDPGYAPWGRMCMDINECRYGIANCDPNADCFNTAGSFVCVCRAGFIGNGLMCSTPPADPCGPGFVLSGNMCLDINECASGTDNCDADATCFNTLGSFVCVCNPGFSGDGVTCIELVPCEDVPDQDEEISRTPGGRIRTGTRRTPGGGTRTTSRGRSRRSTRGRSRSRTDETGTDVAGPPMNQRLCLPGDTAPDAPDETTVERTPGGRIRTRTGTTRGTRRG